MRKERFYTSYIRDAIKDYFMENFKEIITDYEIYEMDKHEVLKYFLEWEGIIGYTSFIEQIMDQE